MDVEAFRKSGLEKIWILNKDLVIKEPTTEDVTEEESAAKTKVYIYNPKRQLKTLLLFLKMSQFMDMQVLQQKLMHRKTVINLL